MNTHYNHIIEKVYLEVNTSKLETANSIKDNISKFLTDELFPRLELLFSEYNIPETVVRYDKLSINLSVDNIENMEHIKHEIYYELETRFKQHLEIEIEQDSTKAQSGNQPASRISLIKDLETSFLFFLENGYLPWYAKEEYITEFTKEKNWNLCLKDKDFIKRLGKLLKDKNTAVERFILQFPIETVFSFVEKSNHLFAENKKQFMKIFDVLRDNLRVSFLRFLVKVSLFDKQRKWKPILKKFYLTILENEKQLNRFAGFPFVSQFKEVIQKIVSEKGVTDFIAFENDLISKSNTLPNLISESSEIKIKEEEIEQRFIENELTEIAVQNAGLILLHPFIKSFFERIDILERDGLVKKNKLDVAVQSLHYLATGDEIFFEGNVIFEKYLCGALLKMPIPFESMLTEIIKDEGIDLLNQAIKNWPALKNTSPDGLRQMFINRDGKLIKSNNSCKLIVERKAQDALLDKLNWNISIVKFPWRKELLFVEW
ncbi:MAG: hypothetical protein L3J54_13345 [Draconibacterium sp.]|nr:hypothetical protein [Draconibacterium sp.]